MELSMPQVVSHCQGHIQITFTLTLCVGCGYIALVTTTEMSRLGSPGHLMEFWRRLVAMRQVVIENPILNSPFVEPIRHFKFTDEGITNDIVLKGFSGEDCKYG